MTTKVLGEGVLDASLGSGQAQQVYAPSGRYITPPGPPTSVTLSDGNMRFVHQPIARPCTADIIGIECTTAGASSVVRLGIYAVDPLTGLPSGAPILDAGTVSTASTGNKEISISQALRASTYLLVAVQQGGTSPVLRAVSFHAPSVSFDAAPNNFTSWQTTGVSGALPTTPTPAQTGLVPPRIYLRVA